MIEITIHGRGGLGAVTAARLLAEAAFREGKHCQAFPSFGAERRGAPVAAFVRINEKPIRARGMVYAPDHVVVLDPSLIDAVEITQGLKRDGWVIINSKNKPNRLSWPKIAWVDATTIANETLGRPIVNTAMLGALVKVTEIVSLTSLTKTVEEYFKGKGAVGNVNAVRQAYEGVRTE